MRDWFECTAFKGPTLTRWQRFTRWWMAHCVTDLDRIELTPEVMTALARGTTLLFNPDPQIHAAAVAFWRQEPPRPLAFHKDAFSSAMMLWADGAVTVLEGTGRSVPPVSEIQGAETHWPEQAQKCDLPPDGAK